MYSEKPKFKKSVRAVLATDASNKKKKALYEFYKDDNRNYCLVINDQIDGYLLHEAIVSKFNQKDKELEIDLDSFIKILKDAKQIEMLITVLATAFNYAASIPFSMKTTAQPSPLRFNISGTSVKKYASLIKELEVVAQAQSFVRKLQDMPSCQMYPKSFVEHVQTLFKGMNVKITVLDKAALTKKKMFSLLGVGQAATDDNFTPRLMIIEYNANPSSKQKRAYVGKGVCFDAGGYNIKTGNNMRWMKYDMSGAAIVAGTVFALAKNKVKTNVVAVCPLVMNLVNEKAQRPDDIVVSYSGKTIEIDNTDAEGRLILVDALTYAAKDLKATKLYDVATLTGAMIYSLGDTFTGTWATSDEMWNEVNVAALLAGELVWRLPFHSDFLGMLKSKFADIVNSCNGPAAGSSRAACFLKEFTQDKPYVHFDVAATADKNNTGTGILLKTLYNVAKSN